MRNVRRGLAVVLALVMLLPSILIPGMAAGKYQDVSDTSWYSAAVEYVTEKGYMAGVSEDSFAPNTPVTRAMFVTVLAKVAGVKGLDDTVSVFSDVPAGKWYTGSVAWAAQNGIVSGVSATEFAPNRKITRQDMCVILSKFVQVMEYELPQNGAASFNDAATISSYARGAVAECTAANLIAGFSDGTFRPKGTATRAQIAVIIMRLAELLEGKPVDPVPMPAQEFNGAAGEDMTVAVNAPEGALPENTNMTVSRVTDEAALAAIAEKTGAKVYAAADITFTKDGAELEPEKAVEVQISLDGLENLKNPTVYHLRSDDTVEVVSSEFVSVNRSANDKALRFYAKDFSVYIIGEGSDTKLLTVEFRDKSGSVISVQALRISTLNNEAYVTGGKDYIYDPGVPAITATQSFEGWADKQNYSETDHGYSVEEINNLIKDNRQTYINGNQSVTLTYYAKVYNVRYVVYHDQAGSVLMSQAFHVEDNNGTVSPKDVEIDWPYVGFKGGQNFVGWIEESGIEREDPNNANSALLLGDYPLYKENVGQIYLNGQTYSLSQTVELYPYLNTGHTIVFDTLKDQDLDPTSTTFVSPDFYAEGERTAAPEKPVRVGYEFVGWYENPTMTQARNENNELLYIDNVTHELTTNATTNGKDNEKRMIVLDENWGTEYVFGSVLNESTKLYARWRAKATTYHISVWQQVANDVIDNNNLNNEYAYYEPTTVDVVLNATTGDKVSLAEAYKLLGNQNDSATTYGEMGYYFVFNEARSNQENEGGTVTVKGDGSTVLNAYYDRKLITISFYTSSSMNTLWSGGDVYVPVDEDGQYYYYTAPYATGYYLIGTGPNADATYSSGTTVYYHDSYSSSNLPSYDNVTKYYSSGMTSHTLSSSNTYVSWNNYENTLIYDRGSYYTNRYRPLYYQYTAPYASGYYEVGKGPDPTAAGTHNKEAFANPMVGLYQAPLDNWPTVPGAGQEWQYLDAEDEKTYGISVRDCFDIPDNTHTTEWNLYAQADSHTSFKTVHWMVENVDDSNFTEKTVSSLGNDVTQYYDNNKFLGFNAYGHNLSANSTTSGFVAYTKGAGVAYSDVGNDCYIYFTRRTNNFLYISNGETIKTVSDVKYQAKLDSFGSYEPEAENTPEGYYFDGWYADPGCTEEYVFTGNEMPEREVAIYAKWVQIRFRVVFEPRGDKVGSIQPSDIVIPNGQSTTFRIDYGETVQGANFDLATYQGHTLLGWYLDTDPNNDTVYDTPFSFGMPMTTKDGMADMTYGDASAAARAGVDPWKNDKPYNDADGENDDVVGKIIIYARWRENPDGVAGINVHYITTDSAGHTGKMANGATEWDDPNIYADQARAFAQPASNPDDTTLQFLYWEILNKDNEVVGKAYPGKLFDVRMADAKITDLTAQAVYVTAPDAAPYEPANAQMVQPEPETRDEEPTREPTRAVHTYRAVTQPSPGKKYLIAYTEGTAAAVMTNSYYNTTYNPNATVVTLSDGVISGDYDDYLFGVEYYNGYYWIGSLNKLSYLSYSTSGTGRIVFGYNSNYDSYSDWAYNPSTKILQNRGVTGRYLYLGGSNSTFYFYANTTGDEITFFELDEGEVAEGTDFYRTEELRVGDKVVIAHDNFAMSNVQLGSTTAPRLDYVRVDHVVTGEEHITVPTGQANAVQWEVVSGNSTDGFVLRNVADNNYLVVNGNGYVSVSNTNDTKWKYSGTDFSNTKNSSYPYLKFSNEFMDFDTTGNENQDIRLYIQGREHTVTFVDGCPGANNAVIATVQVEDGKAATAPEAPAHNGYVFDHWDKSFSNVTEDITVTAVYVSIADRTYTVTFRYMNAQGEWVSEDQTVKHGNPATAPTVPTPPSGYTFNSWDKRFSSITSNLTVNAVYKMIPTKKYTVNLRAVYGLKTTEAKTHINWYANDGGEANNGAGDLYRQNRLDINQSVAIPTPTTWTAGTWEPGQTIQAPTGLSWPGHTFLGWARVESQTGVDAKAHPEFATVDDCWLIWHEDANASGGGYYTVNLEKDPEYEANGGTADKHEANVAADEMRPYHDMYAVWSAPHFFVYHSSNGVLEAVEMPVKANGTTSASFINDTFDITMLVADGYLYGGYYSSYGGVDTEAVDALAAAYVAPTKNNWTLPTQTARGQSAAYNTNGASIEIDGTEHDFNFVEYTGSSRKNGAKYFWEAGNACTANGQTGFTPVPGEVYYLKEVPDDYLGLKYVYIYDELDKNDSGDMKIKEFFQFTLVDDNLYQSIGFRMLTDSSSMKDVMAAAVTQKSNLSKSYTITQKASEVRPNPTSITINAESFLGEGGGGYVATLKNDEAVNTNFAIVPTWVTKDGVSVGNVPQNLIVPEYQPKNSTSNVVTSTDLEGYIGTEKLYVRSSKIGFWQDANAITRLYFFGDGDSNKWVTAAKVKDNVYVCTVPAGNWKNVAVVRCDPAKEGWNARWNQSVDVSLEEYSATEKNQVNLYDYKEYVTVYDHTEERYSAALNELYNP